MARIFHRFDIEARGSNIRREIIGGVSTYMTMAYIVFVQPVVLSAAGMDFGAVMTATCLASGLACLVMGIWANFPIALAPAMGHNFYFAYTVALGMKLGWETALGATLVDGLLFFALTVLGLRERIIDALPRSLMDAMAAGIGLLIAFVGLQWSGLIVPHPGTVVGLGSLKQPATLTALFGFGVMSVLWIRGVTGAILLGIIATALLGLFAGLLQFHGVVSLPPSLAATAFKLDLTGVLSWRFLEVVAVFLFLDIFDTIGTLIGVAPEAGLMKDGRLAGAQRALVADASGTVAGSLLGTSTITCYVESAAGISAGARTGLAAITTGLLLCLTPFFSPLIRTIGAGLVVSPEVTLYPVTAPALILVGMMMMKAAGRVPWDKPGEAIPAFLTIVMMPLTVSITDGIAFGMIAYSGLSLFTGKAKEVAWTIHVCAFFFMLRYIFLV